MIGAPFEKWEEVAGSNYYTGLGSGELIWLLIAIFLCILALWWGHRHESEANASGIPMGGAAAATNMHEVSASASVSEASTTSSSLMSAEASTSSSSTSSKATTAKRSTTKKATTKKAPAKAKKSGPARMTKPKGKADDLKEISGVGPKLEKTLNSLGFWHFEQIAAWKKSDVAIVDDELKFKGRIERDNWIKQAKALAKKK